MANLEGAAQELGLNSISAEEAVSRLDGILSFEDTPMEGEEESEEVTDEVTEEPEAEAEGETEESEQETEDKQSEEDQTEDEESWELPESLNDLAESLGVEADELLNLKVKEKVNGEEREVTLGELRSGHMMEADYRRKTAELAEQRKAFEAQKAEIEQQQSQEYAQKVQDAVALTQALENQLTQEYQSINWQELRQTDPAEYAALQQEMNQRYQSLNYAKTQIGQQFEQSQKEQQQKAEKQFLEMKEKSDRALAESLGEEWTVPEKRQNFTNQLKQVLSDYGFTEQEINTLADSRAILLARDAMRYRSLEKDKPQITNKVRKAPKAIKPTTRRTTQEVKAEKHQKARSRLKKTGDVRDAANALKGLID